VCVSAWVLSVCVCMGERVCVWCVGVGVVCLFMCACMSVVRCVRLCARVCA